MSTDNYTAALGYTKTVDQSLGETQQLAYTEAWLQAMLLLHFSLAFARCLPQPVLGTV
jgi:hypothetical protein